MSWNFISFSSIFTYYYLFNFKRVKNILIIGTNKNAKLMADEILAKKALRMNVVGFVKDTNDDEICVSDSTQIYTMQDGLDKIIENRMDEKTIGFNGILTEKDGKNVLT